MLFYLGKQCIWEVNFQAETKIHFHQRLLLNEPLNMSDFRKYTLAFFLSHQVMDYCQLLLPLLFFLGQGPPPPLTFLHMQQHHSSLLAITHRKLQCASLPAPRDNGTQLLPHCFRRRCFSFASNSSLLKLTELITCAEDLSTCNKINFNLIYSLFLHAFKIK